MCSDSILKVPVKCHNCFFFGTDLSEFSPVLRSTPVTPRQPTQLTTNAIEIGRWEVGTTCHGLNYDCLLISVAFVIPCRVGCLWVAGMRREYVALKYLRGAV